MKSLLALLAIGLLSIGAVACGGTGKATVSSTSHSSSTGSDSTASVSSTAQAPVITKADADKDNDVGAPDDDTSNSELNFGHAANSSDKQAITALVKHYYVAAAAEDGAAACSMLYSTVSETVPEDYGTSPPGPSYSKGKTCTAVMTLSFKHFHNELALELAKLKILGVRLEEHHGLVVLSFGTMPQRDIQVMREGHVWKMESLFDHELS